MASASFKCAAFAMLLLAVTSPTAAQTYGAPAYGAPTGVYGEGPQLLPISPITPVFSPPPPMYGVPGVVIPVPSLSPSPMPAGEDLDIDDPLMVGAYGMDYGYGYYGVYGYGAYGDCYHEDAADDLMESMPRRLLRGSL